MVEPTEQVDKVIQLYETMLTRHTTMVVGPTGGGKTVILHTLARAQTKMDYPTKLFVINPKAQPTSELYGLMGMYYLAPLSFHKQINVYRLQCDKLGQERERYDSDVATAMNYGVDGSSTTSWSKSICNPGTGITRIPRPQRLLLLFEGEHLEQAQTSWFAPIIFQGQASRFPLGWYKISSLIGYPHYDWVDHSGRVHQI